MPHPTASPVVLVIDDDPSIRQFLRTLLELDGFCVYEAKTGTMGIRMAPAVEPTVVLLDVMMPGLNGVETCAILVGENPGLPVVILTARDDPELESSCYAAGAVRFMTKPLLPGQLNEVMASLQSV